MHALVLFMFVVLFVMFLILVPVFLEFVRRSMLGDLVNPPLTLCGPTDPQIRCYSSRGGQSCRVSPYRSLGRCRVASNNKNNDCEPPRALQGIGSEEGESCARPSHGSLGEGCSANSATITNRRAHDSCQKYHNFIPGSLSVSWC